MAIIFVKSPMHILNTSIAYILLPKALRRLLHPKLKLKKRFE